MLTIRRIDIDDARVLIRAAREHAEKIGVPVCIAVADEGGNLMAFERMDGSKPTSAIISIDKSYTAAGAKRATHEIGAASQPGAPAYGIASAIGGRMVVVGGGLPVIVDGEVVGGIGVSAGSPDQDREIAQAGIDAFFETLA
ncbi:GlcG/HbpS family heme-binding protein [Amaricoccus macauensis]|uniref:GlcG/HbpS family heme-binding protein n=1 Tax=Amaricoccus macauensis TaxID=57001 RepID=UPI003C7A37FE